MKKMGSSLEASAWQSSGFLKCILIMSLLVCSGCQSGFMPVGHQPVALGESVKGQAPAILKLPDTLELMAVDGEPVPLLWRGRSEFALASGEHTLDLRYVSVWLPGEYPGSYANSHDIVRSQTQSISAVLQGGVRYEFSEPPKFKTPDAARHYASGFKPQLLMNTGEVLVARVADKSDSPDGAPQLSQIQNEAALRQVPDQSLKGDAIPASPLVESMKVLWLQLNASEKDSFRAFINANAM